MKEPRDYTYFVDRDLGTKFPALLRAAGLKVERLDDHFPPNTPDEKWLAEASRCGWLAVTRDGRIRYSPLALRVLMTSGAKLFVLVGKLTPDECAEVFLHRRNRIDHIARAESAAFIAKIRRDGVFMWCTPAQWLKSQR